MSKPNIVLLTLDTLRADVLHCYGHAARLTPNLDRLAANGIRFEQAITGGTWTQAAFPVIFTSSYAAMYGGCLGRLATERPSPIETLSAHGYTTGGFSTNPHLSRETGYDRGFEHFVDLVPAEVDPRLRQLRGGQRLLRNPLLHTVLAPLGRRLRPARLYSSAAEVTTQVCGWLEQVRQPFFAWAHYMDMHWPYHLEENLARPQEIAQAWQDLALMGSRAGDGTNGTITASQREHLVGLYEQSLRYMDTQLGRLMSQLEKTGQDANTVIIVVADHGEEFLDHGRWGHWESNLHDEIIRVPMLIRLPGGPAGQVVRQQVRLLDLMPTVLELCGSPAPGALMGGSLVPLWTQREGEYDGEAAICEMRRDPWHRIAVRTEEYKYIWDNKRPEQPVLYDLKMDPGERQNVWDRHPAVASRFQASVDAHLRRVAETVPETMAANPAFDEAVLRRLRDLGYVE